MGERGISEEFNSKLDKLLEKTETKSENLIFVNDDFAAMEFCVSPALYKEEGIILKKFQKVIERHGGAVKFNMGTGGHHIIKLVHNKMASFHSDDDLFLSQFILDSVEANRLLNLCDYRATIAKFSVDPNLIMRGLESWEDAKRKRDALEETTANVVVDSSESEENMEMGECSSYSERPHKRRKQYYSIDEERVILNYIVKKRYFYRVKGNAIWKDMEKNKVCGYRTWQSMKERYLNHIIPKIGQFKLNPEKEMKVLMPFGSNNVNTSHDAMKEMTRKPTVETNQEECVKNDNLELISEESSSGIVTKQVHGSKNDDKESGYERLNSESLSGDNTRENNFLESTVNDKNSSKQVVKESTTKEVPNVSSPKSSNNKATEELISIWDTTEPETPGQPHKSDFSDEPTTVKEVQSMLNSSYPIPSSVKEIEELISLWGATEAETRPEQPHLDSQQDISKSFQSNDTGQDKNCHKETENRDIGSTQKFEIQNDEECSSDKGSTQEFDSKLYDCVVNLGTKLNYSFQVQELDHHHSEPQPSSLKKNVLQKSESVKDLNVSHDDDNCQDSNSSIETVIFQTSSIYEKSKNRSLSENSNDEIPLQINSSNLTSVKQNGAKPSNSSKIESHSPSKNKRPVKESKIDESFINKKQKKQKMLEKTLSNRLRNRSKTTKKNTKRNYSSSSSISKNDSYTSSSDSEDDIVPKSRRTKNYTEKEDEMILDYIRIHDLYSFVKGNTMWVDLQKKNLLPGRSWHSLKERFRKRILPRLDKYKVVDRKIIEKFHRYQSNSIETETKKHTKYSEDEDALILKYIIKYKRYREIKGRSLWVNMSTWNPLKTRTWESLKNRFLKNIVPDLESYEISDEVFESFERALKKKRRPANFKKYQLPRKSSTKKLPSRQRKTLSLDCVSLSDEGSSGGQSSPPTNRKKNNLTSNYFTANESDCDVPDICELSSAEDEYENMKQILKRRKEIKHPVKDSKSNPQQISQNPKQDKNVKPTDNCGESFEQECPENVLQKRTVLKRKLFTKNLVGNLYEKTPRYSGGKKGICSRDNRKLPEKIHSQVLDLVGDNHKSPSKEEVNPVNIHSQANEFGDNQMSQPKEVLDPVNIYSQPEGLVDDNQTSPSKEVVNPASTNSHTDELSDTHTQRSPSKKVVNPANNYSQSELVGDNQRSPPKKGSSPVNIYSQTDKFGDNQMLQPKEVLNPVNIYSQSEGLVDDNQKSPSKEVASPANIHSQADEFGDNQRSPTQEVVNSEIIHSPADKFGDNQRSPQKEVLNPVKIHSQKDEFVGNQNSSSDEVVNLLNIPSQTDDVVVGDNQKSPSKVSFLVTADNTDNLEKEETSVIENSPSSSSGLDVSIEEPKCSLNESNAKKEETSVIENSPSSSSGLDVSIEKPKCSLNESNPKIDSSPQAKGLRGRPKGQKSVLLRSKSENSVILTTRLRRRAIKGEI